MARGDRLESVGHRARRVRRGRVRGGATPPGGAPGGARRPTRWRVLLPASPRHHGPVRLPQARRATVPRCRRRARPGPGALLLGGRRGERCRAGAGAGGGAGGGTRSARVHRARRRACRRRAGPRLSGRLGPRGCGGGDCARRLAPADCGRHGALATDRDTGGRARRAGTTARHDRRGRYGARLPHATRFGAPSRKHLRAAMAAARPRRRDGDDRPRVQRVRRLPLPARAREHEAAAGRRLGRPLQRAPHDTVPRPRGLSHRGDQQRAPRDRRLHPDRDRGPQARRACPLHAVTPVPVAVLVSGGGTNLQALLDALRDSAVARIARVVSSSGDAPALERARRAGLPVTVLADPADSAEVVRAAADARLVVLAGYLKRVPPAAVARFRWRLINIHPALLPAFGGDGMYGRRVHEAVLASGAALSGATVHYVDEEYDRGPILAQWPVPVRADDTPDSLAARVLEVGHRRLHRVARALAAVGVPERPVRLVASGSAFVAADEPSVRFGDDP